MRDLGYAINLSAANECGDVTRHRSGQDGGMTDDRFEACWHRWERADSRRQDMVYWTPRSE
jgi:hypothetical protein